MAACYEEAGWQPFILRYSVGEKFAPLFEKPMKQLAWAMVHVRETFPDMFVAVCGFSAGGNVCACLGVHWNDAEVFTDTALHSKIRPDGMILAYPAVDTKLIDSKDFKRLLAGDDMEKYRYFSAVEYINGKTPPAFLWHTVEDEMVPVLGSLKFTQRLIESRVPVELHLFPYGIHGLSIATPEVDDPQKDRLSDIHVATWMNESIEWLSGMSEKFYSGDF